MAHFGDYFDHPGYLWLLLLLPVIWALSFRSLAGLGHYRRLCALGLRSLVLLLIVLALAELQFVRVNDRITVIYLLDQSASIPQSQREAMLAHVKAAVSEHRDDNRRDRAALVIFGRNANIEVPPLETSLPISGQLESLFDLKTDATNLAAGMKLAQATFPEDSSRRVVIVTDGNENLGDAEAIAKLLADDGVGIDVVPIQLGQRPEVFVERVTLPADIRKGQPFEVRAVLTNMATPAPGESGEIAGKVRLTRRAGQVVETLNEAPVVLAPGKNVFPFSNQIEAPDFYEYEVTFVPDDPDQDVMAQNNRATAFTHVLGAGHVLLIENWESPGEFDFLVKRLRAMNIEVTTQRSDQLFASLAELQRYDSVVLANVPRTSGDSVDLSSFSDSQIEMLVRNTADSGCGLIMLGGDQSFGAGGWSNTELEKAMPVDFQIHNAKVVPVGALAMVMHASEMAQGNFWQKKIAEEALSALGPQDYCGVIHWNGSEEWLWANPQGLVPVGPNRRRMRAMLSRMTPGDMPDFDPSLRLAAASFRNCPAAAIKHMIVISDGDPSAASANVLQEFVDQKVKITTVAVGTHGPAGHQELQNIARQTNGKYYVVNNPQALPRIFQREARRVARPLVKEGIVQPQLTASHEILQGIETPPPISGFVLTNVKKNNLVEVLMTSPEPANRENATVLAAWTYNFGRTAVLTTDAGHRWADGWTQWDGYDKLFSQLVRWSMRPTGDEGSFSVATEEENGKVRVIVTALDQDDNLMNFLNMSGSVVSPNMSSSGFALEQTAPGRYVGEVETEQAGSYFMTVMPGGGHPPIRSGINVPYSSEFRERDTNTDLLQRLADLEPEGGNPGMLIPVDFDNPVLSDEELSAFDNFRRDLANAISSRGIWPLLVLASSCVFFGDIFVRRVSFDFDWAKPYWDKFTAIVLRREPEPVVDERMQRLRQRKQQVDGSLDDRRAATRFEVSPDADVDTDALDEGNRPPTGSRPAASSDGLKPEAKEEDDYTSRLLKAKRKAIEERKKRED